MNEHFSLCSGGGAAAEESCTQYLQGCQEILDENREARKLMSIKFFCEPLHVLSTLRLKY